MAKPPSDPEVETQLALATGPLGGGPHDREKRQAATWLLEHADRAYPTVRWQLEEQTASSAVIALAARFDRAESIGALERLLAAGDSRVWDVGQALAKHSAPSAGAALRRALASPKVEAAIGAADALATRRTPAEDCAALVAKRTATDARLRYHVVQAAAAMGCLDRAQLEDIARADPDADIRGLATARLQTRL